MPQKVFSEGMNVYQPVAGFVLRLPLRLCLAQVGTEVFMETAVLMAAELLPSEHSAFLSKTLPADRMAPEISMENNLMTTQRMFTGQDIPRVSPEGWVWLWSNTCNRKWRLIRVGL